MYDRRFTVRVNARFTSEEERMLSWLMAKEGSGVSAILKKAVAAYYKAAREAAVEHNRLLLDGGSVGCGEGAPDLSSDYKRFLDEGLDSKW